MFSKLAMTVLVAVVGLSGLHVVVAGPVDTATPTCPKSNMHSPLEIPFPTRPICCTSYETPPGFYTCEPYKDNAACPSDKPVVRCCYGADPYHPVYHCNYPN